MLLLRIFISIVFHSISIVFHSSQHAMLFLYLFFHSYHAVFFMLYPLGLFFFFILLTMLLSLCFYHCGYFFILPPMLLFLIVMISCDFHIRLDCSFHSSYHVVFFMFLSLWIAFLFFLPFGFFIVIIPCCFLSTQFEHCAKHSTPS
jgi:hypothetical protein